MYITIEDLRVRQKDVLESIESLQNVAKTFYKERGIDTDIKEFNIIDLIEEIKRTLLLCQVPGKK